VVRPVVHSVKHYVQYPFSDIGFGTKEGIVLVNVLERSAVNLANEVAEGSIIKAIFIEIWLQNAANDGEFILTITKDPEGGNGPTFAEQASLFTYTNKKNVLYTTQGLTSNDGVSGSVPVLRQFLKIPKSKQRFGLGDRLNMVISNVSSNDLHRCGFSTYKEYS